MGGITGGTIPALIWKDVMTVATEPYGNVDFEYPEVILQPFKASYVSVVSQEKKDSGDDNKSEDKSLDVQKDADPANIKPNSIKTTEILQQTLAPIKKKETPTVETKQERVEPPAPNFAPVPMTTAPVGQ